MNPPNKNWPIAISNKLSGNILTGPHRKWVNPVTHIPKEITLRVSNLPSSLVTIILKSIRPTPDKQKKNPITIGDRPNSIKRMVKIGSK